MEEKNEKKHLMTLDEKLTVAGVVVGFASIVVSYAYGFHRGRIYEDEILDRGVTNLTRDGFLKMTDPNSGERLSLDQWGRAIKAFYRRNK